MRRQLQPGQREWRFNTTHVGSFDTEALALFRLAVIVACTGASLAFASGCQVEQNKQLAQQAVHQFHDRLNSGAFRDVYREADSELRTASSESAFVDFLGEIPDSLGTVQRSTNISSMSLVATGRETRVRLRPGLTWTDPCKQ